MMNDEPLRPYCALVDDASAFLDAHRRRLDHHIVANTRRIARSDLIERLAARGITVRPSGWHDAALRWPRAGAPSPGKVSEHGLGLYWVQEESALAGVSTLEVNASHRFLDLCAAPGMKTACVAAAMGNRGTIVANDVRPGRMRSLAGNLERLGVINVTLAQGDGARLKLPPGQLFDRVLVDAPCSCLGTARKNPEVLARYRPTVSASKASLQRKLLSSALALCRPGGVVAYMTCTYPPEENEALVDEIIATGRGTLLQARIPGFRFAPGVTRWGSRSYDPSLELAARIWPHLNDTGGFFVALIEKRGRA